MNQIWKKNPATHRSMKDGGGGGKQESRIFDGFAWNFQNLADMFLVFRMKIFLSQRRIFFSQFKDEFSPKE